MVKLTDDGGDTVLAYDVDAQVGGKIAQVGARLIQGTAKKLADQFFSKFAESVGAPPPAAAPSPPDGDAERSAAAGAALLRRSAA